MHGSPEAVIRGTASSPIYQVLSVPQGGDSYDQGDDMTARIERVKAISLCLTLYGPTPAEQRSWCYCWTCEDKRQRHLDCLAQEQEAGWA